MDTKGLKIGDKVAHGHSSSWGTAVYSIKFTEVKKITPTGRMTTADGVVFKPTGHELGEKYHGEYLITLKDAEDMIARDQRRRENNDSYRTLEKALAGKRSGDGNYHFDDEQLAKIKELTELLTRERKAE